MNKLQFDFNHQNFSVTLPDEAARSVWAEIFKEREYKAAETTIISAQEPIVDVGAHIGLFVLYARALNSNVPIYALEPELENFKLLNKNIKENKLSQIKTFQVALGGNSEEVELVLSQDSHNHRLVTAPNPDFIEEKEGILKQVVKMHSLRAFFDQENIKIASLLKMDIEGGEYDVFSACLPGDFARLRAVIMEYHNYSGLNYKAIEVQLRENGFGVRIFPSKFDKKMGFIFAKNKRI